VKVFRPFFILLAFSLWGEELWEPNPFLLSKGEFASYELASFLISQNPMLNPEFALELAEIYIAEAYAESVNHDIAWTQMLLETSFFRFGGQVRPEQNNFAGLGAVDGGNPGLSFPDVVTGVRAQVQHLRRYAGGQGYSRPPVHQRGMYVRAGTAQTIHGLSGTWASDPEYHAKIFNLLYRLHEHIQERSASQDS